MATQPTPEQIMRLPIWARLHIDSLTRELEGERKSHQTLLDPSSPILIEAWPNRQVFGFALGSSIKIRTGPNPHDIVRINLNLHNGDGVHISCGRVLQVLPQASNCINVLPI